MKLFVLTISRTYETTYKFHYTNLS